MNAMEVSMRMLETGNNNQIIESDQILASGQTQMSEFEQNQANESGQIQTYLDLTEISFNPSSRASKNRVISALNNVVQQFR
jgi:hypothetical protein